MIRLTLSGLLCAWLGLTNGCGNDAEKSLSKARGESARIADFTTLFRAQPIGAPADAPPWIAHLIAVDLDRDGSVDVVACEAQRNQVVWLRQTSPGVFAETVLATDLRAPVHVESVDLDGDSDLDLLVASMGYVFLNNDRIGTVFVLENDGHQHFIRHTILENTARVTDVRAVDLNGDGRLDLVLAQFGYDQGEVSWLECTGPWQYQRHLLEQLSGAINVCVVSLAAVGGGRS